MGKYKRLGKNTLLVFSGSAGAKVISFLMLPLYTQWLSVSQYGTVDLISVYASLLLGIVSLSIFESIFIFPKGKDLEDKKKYFSTGIIFWVLTLFLAFTLIIIVKCLSYVFNIHGFFLDNVWLIFGLLSFSYLQQLNQQFLRAIDKMAIYAYTGLIQTLTMVVMAFLLIPHYKVNGYIFSMIIGEATSILYSVFFGGTYKYFHVRLFCSKYLRQMLRYSIPIIPNGLMWFLVNSLNRPLLEDYASLAAVGLMAIASKIPNILNLSYNIFQQAWIVSALEESKKENYVNFYNRMLKIIVFLQLFFALLLVIFSKSIMYIFTSEEFHDAWIYIPLLTLGVIFINIATFVGSNFAITKESKYYFYATLWAGLSSLILNLLLIPKFHIWGATIAIVVSQFIGMAMRIKFSWKFVRITELHYFLINICLLLSASTFVIFYHNLPQIIILGATSITVFLMINMYFFRNEIAIIKSKIFIRK